MPGPGSGRQAEGVSSLSKRPYLIECNLSSPVKEVSSLAVQGAKSSIPISLESNQA